jgi:AbrB family looped-hinge helix DNA binding protein
MMVNGKINGMKLRIDRSGRIVVPKPLRKKLGLHPDQELELLEQPNGVLLRPVKQEPSLVKVGGVLVHQGVVEPNVNWDRLIDDVREERIQGLLKP